MEIIAMDFQSVDDFSKSLGEDVEFELPPVMPPCPDCIEKAEYKISKLVWAYCKHHQSGAYMFLILNKPSGWWTMKSQITENDFKKYIRDILVMMEKTKGKK